MRSQRAVRSEAACFLASRACAVSFSVSHLCRPLCAPQADRSGAETPFSTLLTQSAATAAGASPTFRPVPSRLRNTASCPLPPQPTSPGHPGSPLSRAAQCARDAQHAHAAALQAKVAAKAAAAAAVPT